LTASCPSCIWALERPVRTGIQALKYALGRGGWSILDQALFALSNFLLQIVLSRHVAEVEFGAFAVGLSAFFLACALHQASIIEPMLVFGSSRYRDHLREYLSRLVIYWNSAVALFFVVLLTGAGFVLAYFDQPLIARAFWALSFATFPVLLFWSLRRICYLESRPQLAAAAGAVYIVCMALALYVLTSRDLLDLTSAGLTMAGAGLAASCYLYFRLGFLRLSLARRGAGLEAASEHLRYARWSLSSESLHWFVTHYPFIILPLVGGLDQTASYRLITLVFMPLYQALSSIASLSLPHVTRSLESDGQWRYLTIALFVFFAGSAVAYAVAVWLAATPIRSLLFGDRYLLEPVWLYGVMLTSLFFCLAQPAFIVLRAVELPRAVTVASLALALVLVLLLPLQLRYELTGIVFSQAAAWAVAALLAIALAVRVVEKAARR
jgi:O-antigen/teichoic acid export membrane protein